LISASVAASPLTITEFEPGTTVTRNESSGRLNNFDSSAATPAASLFLSG
jgi:hypothetical protein